MSECAEISCRCAFGDSYNECVCRKVRRSSIDRLIGPIAPNAILILCVEEHVVLARNIWRIAEIGRAAAGKIANEYTINILLE